MLPKKNRLKKKKVFSLTFNEGFCYITPSLELRFKKGQTGKKIGLVAPARVFKKAVDRNRTKRKMAEAVRPLLEELPEGINIILIAKEPIAGKDFSELKEIIEKLLSKIPNDR